MFQGTYKCQTSGCGKGEAVVTSDRHPIFAGDNVLPCTSCQKPMTLTKYKSLYPPPQTDAKRGRKVGTKTRGQSDLDFTG